MGTAAHASLRGGRDGSHRARASEEGRAVPVQPVGGGARGTEGAVGLVEGLDLQDQIVADGAGVVRMHRGGQGGVGEGVCGFDRRAVGWGEGIAEEFEECSDCEVGLSGGGVGGCSKCWKILHSTRHKQRHPRGEQLSLHHPRHDPRSRPGILGIRQRRRTGQCRRRQHPQREAIGAREFDAEGGQDEEDEGTGDVGGIFERKAGIGEVRGEHGRGGW
mmetsp:Transcript_37421/g.63709  ORF Transcript_37421/g.63709 Transcript_37421/m.63709 type:complete len:218 (-) Transcript_37421:716-1369(-)